MPQQLFKKIDFFLVKQCFCFDTFSFISECILEGFIFFMFFQCITLISFDSVKNWEEECSKPPPKKRVKKSKITTGVECAEQKINDTADQHTDTKNANSSEELLLNERGHGKKKQRKRKNKE